MSILVEIEVRRKKNQLLKPLIEKFKDKVTIKEIAINNRKNPKEIDLYLIILSNVIAYNIIYDIIYDI